MVDTEHRRAVLWRVNSAAVLAGVGIGSTCAAVVLLSRKLFDGHTAPIISGLGLLTLLTLLLAAAGTAVVLLRRHQLRPVMIPMAVIAVVAYLTLGLGVAGDRDLAPAVDAAPGVALTVGALALAINAGSSARRRVRPLTPLTALVIVAASVAAVIPWTGTPPSVETTTSDQSDTPTGPQVIRFAAEKLSYTADSVIGEDNVDSGFGDSRTTATKLVSRSLRDGSTRWRATVRGYASIYSLPATVIVTTSSPPLTVALDARTGKSLWTMPGARAFGGLVSAFASTDEDPGSPGASYPALLFTDDTQTTVAVGDERTGGLRWRHELGDCPLTGDPRVIADTVIYPTACPAQSGIAAVQKRNTVDLTTGNPTSEGGQELSSRTRLLGIDEVRSVLGEPVTIMVGTSDRVRRTLGRGTVSVSPDGRVALFADAAGGRMVVVHADGRPDVVVNGVDARDAYLSDDTVWTGGRYAVTLMSKRLTVVDTTRGTVNRPPDTVSRLRRVTSDAVVAESVSPDLSTSRLIFTGLTPG